MQPFLRHAASESCSLRTLAISQRAGIAVAAFCMQLALGAVYGWSVFLSPLQEQFGAGKPAVNLTFTITLAVLGVTAGFGGSLQRRIGPRATATLAGVLYGAGTMLSGFAPTLPALYLAHGVLGGIGLGFGYIVPLAVLIGWFPDRRGFISGLAVTGFGLGALATSPIATALIAAHGVQTTLMMLGGAYFVVIAMAAQVLRPAPENYAPPGWTPPLQSTAGAAVAMTLAQALRTPRWHMLWWMLALNVMARRCAHFGGGTAHAGARPRRTGLERAGRWFDRTVQRHRPPAVGDAFRYDRP
jgi:OFA family oxalate/formate antiporter-like MFS transporter